MAIGRDPWIELRDLQTGKAEIQFPHFIGMAEAIAFSPSGRLLAVGNDLGKVFILDINNPDKIQKIEADVNGNSVCLLSKVAFSENDEYLAATSYGGNNQYSILLWKRDGDTFVNLYSMQEAKSNRGSTLDFASGEEGTTVLAATGKDGIHIWNLLPDISQLLTKIDGWHQGHFSADGRYFLAKRDDELQIWDWQTQTPHEHVVIPGYYDFSQDGSVLISFNEASQIQIWDGTKLLSSQPELTADQPKDKQLVTLGQIKRNQLLQNFPNPFNPETWIPFRLTDKSSVTIRIYTPSGKLVRSLSPGIMSAGDYSSQSEAVYWDGRNDKGEPVSSGVYLYTINAGDFSAIRKMLIRK